MSATTHSQTTQEQYTRGDEVPRHITPEDCGDRPCYWGTAHFVADLQPRWKVVFGSQHTPQRIRRDGFQPIRVGQYALDVQPCYQGDMGWQVMLLEVSGYGDTYETRQVDVEKARELIGDIINIKRGFLGGIPAVAGVTGRSVQDALTRLWNIECERQRQELCEQDD